MYQQLLLILFRHDDRFLRLHDGIAPSTRATLQDFWSAPQRQALTESNALLPQDAPSLAQSLAMLASQSHEGTAAVWREAAEASDALAQRDPLAAAIVALQALGAWVGALGAHLFEQPWTGHNPGWHLFPLLAARRLLQLDAVWGTTFLCDTAAGFIEAAKDAPFDPVLRNAVNEYVAVKAAAEARIDDCVGELAWAFREGAAGAGAATFRAELAALFWTAGDTLHARLLGPDGAANYLPPLSLVRTLVDHSIRFLHREPLMQYIWLAMKDRGPFPLREHRVLFGHMNNRFHSHVLHELDEIFPVSVSRAYAAALIAVLRGDLQDAVRSEFLDAFALGASLIEARAPDAYLRLLVLANATAGPPGAPDGWPRLARLATDVMRWTDDNGIYEPLDHVLDPPFYELPSDTTAALEDTLAKLEAYRQAGLGYWLSMAPPLQQRDEVPEAMRAQEEELLRELRGARFIRLLPHLPAHYRRYGFNISEALQGPPPGVPATDAGLLKFDPFDQTLAQRNLGQTRERLRELYETLRAQAPAYAAVRLAPLSSAADFVAALSAHRRAR